MSVIEEEDAELIRNFMVWNSGLKDDKMKQ
jgi:hypothetical protein